MDGDGKSDLVVSRRHGFRVYLTRPSAQVQDVTLPHGKNPSSFAVADFNGDNHDDVAVGDPTAGYDSKDQVYDGAFLVYNGTKSGVADTPSIVFRGAKNSGDVFGQALIPLNLNNDAYRDVLEVPDQNGGVKEFIGTKHGLKPATKNLLGGSPRNFAVASGSFGAIAVGDVTGDGRPDLAVGLPGNGKQLGHGDDFRGTEGVIKVFYGTAHGFGSRAHAVHGRPAGTRYGELGSSLSIAKVNGDSYADVVSGAPGDRRGAVAVLYGGGHGLKAKRDTVISFNTKGVPDANGNDDGLGLAVSTGDFNGDGLADIVAGAPNGTHYTNSGGVLTRGKALVLYGAKHRVTATGSQVLAIDSDFPKLSGNDAYYGDAVVAYHPRGARFASVAVLAPSFHRKHRHGLVGIYRGTKGGLDVANASRLIGVGKVTNFSTGAAIAP